MTDQVEMTQTDELVDGRKRTVSTSFLETLRESKNLSVLEFLKELVSYEVNAPSESFKDSLNNYADANKAKSKGSTKSNTSVDKNKLNIEYVFDNNLSPIQNCKLVRVSVSRKKEHDDNMYAVTVEYSTGTKATFYANCNVANSVQFMMPDGYGELGNPVIIYNAKTIENTTTSNYGFHTETIQPYGQVSYQTTSKVEEEEE